MHCRWHPPRASRRRRARLGSFGIQRRRLVRPISCDITHDERVRGAFGFSLPEVTSLAEELLEDMNVRMSFLDEVKASEPAYRHKDYIEYSMNDVLCRLRQRTGQPGLEEEEFYYYRDSDDSDSDDDEDIEMEEVEDVLRAEDISA
ncbi:hypothetical protein BDZ89DRAFT_748418 [Hymenopellis radicata]|nr:hypothetical protein BDZ89DRAFT_748418 [Hymenopellis radicata]